MWPQSFVPIVWRPLSLLVFAIYKVDCSMWIIHSDVLVYRITNGDGSGYNRKNGVQLNTKSKVEGAIQNEEYRSQEA